MATYTDYLSNLTTQKSTMVSNINTIYQTATGATNTMAHDDETINSLVAKVPILGVLGMVSDVKSKYSLS